MEPKYPDVTVKLVGEDGNAFAILGRVGKALRRHAGREVEEKFIEEATAGDYDFKYKVVQAGSWLD